jgi:integrase
MPRLAEQAVYSGHALDAYAVFLRTQPRSQRGQLYFARRFARHYPDLADWLAAPLDERIGSTANRRGAAWAVASARPYVYFLVSIGRIELDWAWILAITDHRYIGSYLPPSVIALEQRLANRLLQLGYRRAGERVGRAIRYFYLRYGDGVLALTAQHFDELAAAWHELAARNDLGGGFDDGLMYRRQATLRSACFGMHLALYHEGLMPAPPRRTRIQQTVHRVKPAMAGLLRHYRDMREATDARPTTAVRYEAYGRHLADWLWDHHPDVSSFADITREQILAYAKSLVDNGASVDSRISRLSGLSVMFHDTTAWGWPDAPVRPIIGSRDLPRRPLRMPRFIPSGDLERLMEAIRQLPDVHQRTALIVARWSGARRSEITRLELDCLDSYPDGTPRLRIPAGKTARERLIPLHPEAAAAITELRALDPPGRGFADALTGVVSRRLFSVRGQPRSAGFLFEDALGDACRAAGLVDKENRPKYSAHRFRHTIGTELIEGGARVHTVMKMLGHTSTGMTLVYAHLSDSSVREDYMKVLGPGAIVAGSLAEAIRTRTMPEDSLAWLKTNFFRTELELGHCLRLPDEGPCECDLYLTCAKFVTTPDYAPRLRERRLREIALADDAQAKGFQREAERHDCTRRRIEQLLTDLGEGMA